MGYSISWVAIKSKDLTAVFDTLKLKPGVNKDEYFESRYAGCQLKNGWYLIYANEFQGRLTRKETLSQLSFLGKVIACGVEEHIMYSSVSWWERGELKWNIVHDSQENNMHLFSDGELPACYKEIKIKLFQEQELENQNEAEVDFIFEIPLVVAQHFTSFKHDEENGCFEVSPIELISEQEESNKPWWQFW